MDKIDWTKPIETLVGGPARLLGQIDRACYPYVVAVSAISPGRESVYLADDMGRVPPGGEFIRNVAPKRFRREVWVNLYAEGSGHSECDMGHPRRSVYSAIQAGATTRSRPIARKRIIIEGNEGEFDE